MIARSHGVFQQSLPWLKAGSAAALSLLTPARAFPQAPEAVDIVVEGNRAQPQAPPHSPHVSGSVIPRERLEQPGLSAAQALREVPGVQSFELGGFGAPATASLRGATAAQTPVYLAGVRINDEVGGAANLSEIPLFFVERIEVYRSHAPLIADQLGIGGALWFEPRTPERNQAEVGALVGSFGTRGAFGFAAMRNEDRAVLVGAELVAADNKYPFHSGNGTLFDPSDDRTSRLENVAASRRSLWLSVADRAGPARLRLLYHHGELEQGVPKLALTPSRVAHGSFDRDLLALTSSIPIDSWGGGLELISSAVASSTTLDDPQSELSLESPKTRTPGERLEQTILARQSGPGRTQWTEQLVLSEERLRRFEFHRNAEEEALAARRLTARAAASLSLPVFGPLSAEALLAWTAFGTTEGGRAHGSEQQPSGRLGVNLQHGNFEIYASGGLYQRPPTLSELYGASLLVRGNPELDLERGSIAEAGVRLQQIAEERCVAWLDLAGFARQSRQLIFYVRSAQGYVRPLNRDNSRTLGAEATAGWTPIPFVNLELSLTLLDPRASNRSEGAVNDILPYQSRSTASALISFGPQLDSEWLESLRLGLRGFYQSNRYPNQAGAGEIPEQGLVDLEAAAIGLYHSLNARLRVADVFDSPRYDVVGFPLPRRSVFLSMEAKL